MGGKCGGCVSIKNLITAGVRIEKDNGSVSKEMRMRWWKLTEVMLLALWG